MWHEMKRPMIWAKIKKAHEVIPDKKSHFLVTSINNSNTVSYWFRHFSFHPGSKFLMNILCLLWCCCFSGTYSPYRFIRQYYVWPLVCWYIVCKKQIVKCTENIPVEELIKLGEVGDSFALVTMKWPQFLQSVGRSYRPLFKLVFIANKYYFFLSPV